MKALIFYSLLFSISLLSCKINQSSTQFDEYTSKVTVKCSNHNVKTSYFSGKVIDARTGEALVSATVTIKNIETKAFLGYSTDIDGNFIFKNLQVGTYQLKVKYFSYDAIDQNIEIKEYSNCVSDIKLYAKQIHTEKPVIYIYPTQQQQVHVQLNYAGNLTHTYPKYPENGWNVKAEPNGTLWDENGMEYYALFWEGIPHKPLTAKDGFVIAGKETAKFLEEKLAYLGLNRREANEFIMYWLPKMENNAYNLIHFSGEDYEKLAELKITPQPETIIRVMMVTEPLTRKIDVPLQDLKPLHKTRKGFTVVEWGGSELNHTNVQ